MLVRPALYLMMLPLSSDHALSQFCKLYNILLYDGHFVYVMLLFSHYRLRKGFEIACSR